MKKNWTNPELEVLNVNNTMDGAAPNQEPDGPVYQDVDGKWKVDIGVLES